MAANLVLLWRTLIGVAVHGMRDAATQSITLSVTSIYRSQTPVNTSQQLKSHPGFGGEIDDTEGSLHSFREGAFYCASEK
jgi:hypothetical protein